jgi:predicted GNAT family acetyltransferase
MADSHTQANAVLDEPRRHRFLYQEDGVDSQLIYRVDGDRLVLVHTEVPQSLGGRGIGGRLVMAAVERAAKTCVTIVPWCPYARKWLQDHPEVASRVAIDWTEPPA